MGPGGKVGVGVGVGGSLTEGEVESAGGPAGGREAGSWGLMGDLEEVAKDA